MEKQTLVPTVRRFKMVILLCFVLVAVTGFSMSRHSGVSFALSRQDPRGESQVEGILNQDRHRLLDAADLEQFRSDLDNFDVKEKRADQNDRKEKKKKKKSLLDQTFMRILIGIGVFAVFNVAVITIHHIVHKLSTNPNQYREIEHVYSPF